MTERKFELLSGQVIQARILAGQEGDTDEPVSITVQAFTLRGNKPVITVGEDKSCPIIVNPRVFERGGVLNTNRFGRVIISPIVEQKI